MYTSYIKMHYYCKKAIAGKKLVLKRSVLHLCNDVRWLNLRLHPQTALRRGGTFEYKGEEGSYAFSKVLLHKHNLLSERRGVEPLQSAVSLLLPGKIILKARFWTRSSCCSRCDCTLLIQTWQAYSKTDRTREQYIVIKWSGGLQHVSKPFAGIDVYTPCPQSPWYFGPILSCHKK